MDSLCHCRTWRKLLARKITRSSIELRPEHSADRFQRPLRANCFVRLRVPIHAIYLKHLTLVTRFVNMKDDSGQFRLIPITGGYQVLIFKHVNKDSLSHSSSRNCTSQWISHKSIILFTSTYTFYAHSWIYISAQIKFTLKLKNRSSTRLTVSGFYVCRTDSLA